MAFLESIGLFFLSLFCFGSCYGMQKKYYEQEAEILRLERNEVPPQYTEDRDPAPPYNDTETTPILIPQADQRLH